MTLNSDKKLKASERLYKHAFIHKENMAKLKEHFYQQDLMKEMKEVSFKPKLVSKKWSLGSFGAKPEDLIMYRINQKNQNIARLKK